MSSTNPRISIGKTRDENGNKLYWTYLNTSIASGAKMYDHYYLYSDGIYHQPNACLKIKAKLKGQITSPARNGSYNYRTILNIDNVEDESLANLLAKIGYALATNDGLDLNTKYLASVFPAGYVLIKHYDKKAGQKERTDNYIHGHPSGKYYKSMDDFVKHYLYLYFDYKSEPDGTDYQPCACTLCQGKLAGRAKKEDIQTEIK